MTDTDRPDREQLRTILLAVIIEYPELEFFPMTVLDATVRAWFSAEEYDVPPQQFAEDMVSAQASQVLAYVSYQLLQHALK